MKRIVLLILLIIIATVLCACDAPASHAPAVRLPDGDYGAPLDVVWTNPVRVKIAVNGDYIWIRVDEQVAADDCRIIIQDGFVRMYGCGNTG